MLGKGRTPVLVLGLCSLLAVAGPAAAPSMAQQADPLSQYYNVLDQKSVWQQRLNQAQAQIDSSNRRLEYAKAKLDHTKASLASTQVTVANLRASTPQQIDQLKQGLSGTQDELDSILKDNTSRQNKLISDLGANQQLIDEADAQLEATGQQVDYAQQQVSLLEAEIAQLNRDMAATQLQLDVFLRFTYKEQRRSLLEYLLDASSFGDLITRIGNLQAMDRQETHLLALAKQQRQEASDHQTQLAAQLQQLSDLQAAQQLQRQTLELQRQHQQQMLDEARIQAQEAKDRLSAKESELQALINQKQGQLANGEQLLQNLKAAQNQLTWTIGSQANTLTQAQQNEQVARTQLDRLEREAEGIAAVIRQAEAGKPAHTYASGRLMWPLRGALTQAFGPSPYWFEPSITYHGVRYAHFHTGIDIAASYGTPILAAADGLVITVGYSPWGYGNYVIVAHNPSLATLYAHLSRVAVGQGTVVKQGQVIGYEGSTGNSTGPHLHFEVRVNGDFVNPLGWL